jgi:hypothetical protein
LGDFLRTTLFSSSKEGIHDQARYLHLLLRPGWSIDFSVDIGGTMLFHSYKITRILPWLAAPEKIRVTAEVSGEIHEAFFDLNGILRRCIYRLRVN